MKRIITIATLLIGFLTFVHLDSFAQNIQTEVNKNPDDNYFYHTIERGQTVYSIAEMYGVKVDEILKLNSLIDDTIKVGEKIKVPQTKKNAKPASDNSNETSYIFHTIVSKETLYGVSKIYNVTGKQILEANPGLSQETFSIGKTIRIPTNVKQTKTTEIVDKKDGKEIYYTVPERETLYNIYKKFKVTDKELLKLNPELSGGLRQGMTLRIPLRINVKDLPPEASETPQEVNEMLAAKPVIKPVNAAKIVLLTPHNAENLKSDAMGRFLEYYEGMLLAVDSLRKKGYSPEFFVYDIGEETNILKKLLREEINTIKDANLIIGGTSNEQIKIISDFALKNKVKYVIPFTQKNDEALNNAYVFQVNAPKEYLYANAAYAGANLYAKYNIIFIDTKDVDPQTDFIKEFKKELKGRNISFQDLIYDANTFKTNITSMLSTDKPNMIMPVSSSIDALNKIKTVLRNLNETKPEYNISLFGYPVWQTYTRECLDDFYALDTYIYSLFFADNENPSVKVFYNDYKNWYSKSPKNNSVPKYSMLGFDTGMFFLLAIKKYGVDFEKDISAMKYKSIQTGFRFERVNNWGGFINTNVYLVHYNKDYTITRSEFEER
jgi:LysM repeat protein/ABC-type branched-subunit amino acid transport system substrate-binding protein